ncbi:MAG: phosphotransferase [Gammaproteobacteria bacterium]|nr:phosphotransferase [Gammaproteobacteria bacterium]
MSHPSSSPDLRAELGRDWALARLGLTQADFAPASADASFRRYFRLRHEGRSWILMDAPPQQEDCRPFLHVARMLRSWGLNAPEAIAEDLQRGFLLLSDLGTQTFLHVINPDNADALFGDAVDALLRMQRASVADPETARLPPYDAALLWREVRLFPDWYLARHLRVTPSAEEINELERVMGLLVDSAVAQPRVFVHRDYMPRNLMLSAPNPGILDFQDAVYGPIGYDAVCLFKDAFLSWPPERVRGWIEHYWAGARRAGLPAPASFPEFWRDVEWMGLQRHLKVLGIFARLTYRDGKAHYVADTPRFVRYVMEVAPRYPELAPLAALFEKHVLPVVPL